MLTVAQYFPQSRKPYLSLSSHTTQTLCPYIFTILSHHSLDLIMMIRLPVYHLVKGGKHTPVNILFTGVWTDPRKDVLPGFPRTRTWQGGICMRFQLGMWPVRARRTNCHTGICVMVLLDNCFCVLQLCHYLLLSFLFLSLSSFTTVFSILISVNIIPHLHLKARAVAFIFCLIIPAMLTNLPLSLSQCLYQPGPSLFTVQSPLDTYCIYIYTFIWAKELYWVCYLFTLK